MYMCSSTYLTHTYIHIYIYIYMYTRVHLHIYMTMAGGALSCFFAASMASLLWRRSANGAWACRSHSVVQSAVAWQSLATWSRAPHRTPHSQRRRALAIGKGSCGRGRRRGAIQGTCAWKGCESEGWFAWRGLMTPILFTCAGMLCMWVSLGACGIHSLGDLTPLCFFRANRSDSI